MAELAVDQDRLITELCGLTGIAPHEAQEYLASNQWDISSAAAEYYTSLEEGAATAQADEDQPIGDTVPAAQSTTPRGGRALDGSSVPPTRSAASSTAMPQSSKSTQPPKKKFATLGDLGGGSSGHAGRGHGQDDDDSDDDEESQDLFAGGEKSALAVQNPDDLKRKIIEKAKKNMGRTESDELRAPLSHFTGTAHTLGDDTTPSQVIQDPAASTPQRPAPAERILHFWSDGFSVDDGPLYRSDDPANAGHLAMIRQGRAPLEIMNVESNQQVGVKLMQHQEKYVQPKKKYNPFGGGGQRLGSPTPSARSDVPPAAAASATVAEPTASASASEPFPSAVAINDSEPTINLQIRLGDGTRLVSRFNTSHTVGDVYAFVNVSSPASRTRSWVLMTTFPSKELSDKALVLGDLAEFKRGGVVVQKWS